MTFVKINRITCILDKNITETLEPLPLRPLSDKEVSVGDIINYLL